MKILTVSVAPWVRSGYGHQAGHAWLQLKKHFGHDVRCYSYRGLIGQQIFWPDEHGVLVYPEGRTSQFGWDVLPFYVDDFEPDMILSLCDLFAFDEVKGFIAAEGWPWYHWIPTDTEPLSAPEYHILNATGIRPVAISAFGRKSLEQDGFNPLYVPHSIDTQNLWVPPSVQERKDARAVFGLRDDAFVIAMDAANEASADRKAFFEQFAAFAAFHARHENSVLFCHTMKNRHPAGLDLESIVRVLGIQDYVFFPFQQALAASAITYENLRNYLYWSADLATCASKAEGFGIPIVQFQACGVPVVVTNHGPMPELVAPGEYGGSKVPGQFSWSTLGSSKWKTPFISDLEDAYEQFYLAFRNDDIHPYRAAARAHSLQYDHAVIRDRFWAPALDQIQAEVASEGGFLRLARAPGSVSGRLEAAPDQEEEGPHSP